MSVELVKLHAEMETTIEANTIFSVVPGDRLILQCSKPEEIISILVRTEGTAGGIMLSEDTSFPYDLGEVEQYIPKLFIIVTTSGSRTRATYDIKMETESTSKQEEKLEPKPIPVPKPAPIPAPEDETSKKVLELEKQLEHAIKEKDEATERLDEAERELTVLRDATKLHGSIEEQQKLISQWRKKLDELQNEEYRLRSFDLADAQEQLIERKEQTEKAKEELKTVEKEWIEQTQALDDQKKKLTQTESLLAAQREKTHTLEQELKSLQNRHCDAQRAKEELEQKRRDLGLMDDELQACEDEIGRVSQELISSRGKLDEVRAQETTCQEDIKKIEVSYQSALDQISTLKEEQTSIESELKKYESEIREMESLRKQRAREWEQLLRNFSALLSAVIKEKFDLEETYNLLIKAMDSKLVENLEAEAAEQRALLDECGAALAKVSVWIGEVKSRKAL